MNLTAVRPSINKIKAVSRVKPGTVYAVIIILAMFSFEIFNYSTTAFSLRDLLGNLSFAGVSWATLLALAFCGIDFAGIARLISPENRKVETKDSWYLFGAWMVAATANASLTWWGVAVAINNHNLQSSSIINTHTLTNIIPIFVAILVWVLRILIIGSLSSALEKLFGRNDKTVNTSESAVTGFNTSYKQSAAGQHAVSTPITMTRISGASRSNRPSSQHFDFIEQEMSGQRRSSDRSINHF
jgi:hypothetical protein